MYGEETVYSSREHAEFDQIRSAVTEATGFLAGLVNGSDDNALKRQFAALRAFRMPVFYRFFFSTPDLCIGMETPCRFIPRWRYLIKKGAAWGILQIKFGWFIFSVRW